MKSLRIAITIVLLLGSALLLAQRTNLRLGTVLPANSVWDRSLKQMASDWRAGTDDRVRLRILSGGSTGDEATILRRMKLGRPQVAALTLLGQVHDAFNVFGIPFFYESDAEALHVLEQLTPRLKTALANEGLILLNWGHGGWTHIFSADPVATLADLKRTKIFTSSGDDGMVRWYKENGFQPVPLAVTDILMGLNTGLIDSYPSPPYGALVFQWYRRTPHMLGIPLSPVFGATVISERAWREIGEADQATLLESAQTTQEHLFSVVPEQDREAVAEMEKRGLIVASVDTAASVEFRAAAEEMTTSWRGGMVPTEIYDAALHARNAYRVDTVALSATSDAIDNTAGTVTLVVRVEDAGGKPLEGIDVRVEYSVEGRLSGGHHRVTTAASGEAMFDLVTVNENEKEESRVTVTAGTRRRSDTITIRVG